MLSHVGSILPLMMHQHRQACQNLKQGSENVFKTYNYLFILKSWSWALRCLPSILPLKEKEWLVAASQMPKGQSKLVNSLKMFLVKPTGLWHRHQELSLPAFHIQSQIALSNSTKNISFYLVTLQSRAIIGKQTEL